MAEQKIDTQRHVIRSVHSRGHDRTRLVLQSVCGADGRRYLRAVWERQEGGEWYWDKTTPPEFSATVWADVIAKAATTGMLSSGDYKNLMVRLSNGLNSTKNPTLKAFVRVTGYLVLSFDAELLKDHLIDEVSLYESLSASPRDVTVTQENKKKERYWLTYQVAEDLHYMEAISRLSDELRAKARRTSLEEAVTSAPQEAFEALFGAPPLEAAGFHDPSQFEVEYRLSVL